ncbi:hypothetical protein D3C86_1817200 [compost metagenome]
MSAMAPRSGVPSRNRASNSSGTVATAHSHGIMSAPSRTARCARRWMMLTDHASDAPSSMVSPITVCNSQPPSAGATITAMPA